MDQRGHAPISGYEYYNFLPFPVDQTSDMMEGQCWYGDSILAASGLSEVQMNTMYNVTENTNTGAPAGIFNHSYLRTDPLIDLYMMKNSDGSIERSGLPFYMPQESCINERLDNFVLSQLMPNEEPASFMDIEWQQAELQQSPFLAQAANMNGNYEFQADVKEEVDTSDIAPKSLSSMSRKYIRSKERESRRRSIISQRMQALQDLLPATLKDKRGNKESIVDDVIRHIKYLQLQLKELGRSKLGGDSSSDPLKFVEGYGHYQPQERICGQSLEEIFGSLLEENPVAARKLLESKGLNMVPVAFVDALLRI